VEKKEKKEVKLVAVEEEEEESVYELESYLEEESKVFEPEPEVLSPEKIKINEDAERWLSLTIPNYKTKMDVQQPT